MAGSECPFAAVECHLPGSVSDTPGQCSDPSELPKLALHTGCVCLALTLIKGKTSPWLSSEGTPVLRAEGVCHQRTMWFRLCVTSSCRQTCLLPALIVTKAFVARERDEEKAKCRQGLTGFEQHMVLTVAGKDGSFVPQPLSYTHPASITEEMGHWP